jgi:hypothetical protein
MTDHRGRTFSHVRYVRSRKSAPLRCFVPRRSPIPVRQRPIPRQQPLSAACCPSLCTTATAFFRTFRLARLLHCRIQVA